MPKLKHIKATLLIIFIWVVLYVINIFVDLIPTLSGRGFNLMNGEYYRIITCALLHTDFLHLLANCLALYWIGYYLECNIGSGKFLLFALVAYIASETVFFSIFRDAENSFGGSSITFALIGLILILQFAKPVFPKLKLGTWYGNWIVFYSVLGNIPILPFMDFSTVVIHLVSFSIGAVLGIPFRFMI